MCIVDVQWTFHVFKNPQKTRLHIQALRPGQRGPRRWSPWRFAGFFPAHLPPTIPFKGCPLGFPSHWEKSEPVVPAAPKRVEHEKMGKIRLNSLGLNNTPKKFSKVWIWISWLWCASRGDFMVDDLDHWITCHFCKSQGLNQCGKSSHEPFSTLPLSHCHLTAKSQLLSHKCLRWFKVSK